MSEVLLLLRKSDDSLANLQRAHGKLVVALAHELTTPLIVGEHVQVVAGDHMDEVLQGVFVHSDRGRVKTYYLEHITRCRLNVENVDSV